MISSAIKTKPVVPGDDLIAILDTYLPPLRNGDIVAITSKIVSICEGSVVKKKDELQKAVLTHKHAQYYLPPEKSRYHVVISITNNTFVASAGIDQSNGNGHLILWPKDPFKSAALVWNHLRDKHNLKRLGVIITDSTIVPLRWGTRGTGISWCGFEPLRDYRGTKDIFGWKYILTRQSIVDGLAGTAVLLMGEGNEQTPLVLIQNAPGVEFVDHPPTRKETQSLRIDPEDDIFAPIMDLSTMKKGRGR